MTNTSPSSSAPALQLHQQRGEKPGDPARPFSARWHQTKEAGASSPGAARTHRPRPGPGRPGQAAPFEDGGRGGAAAGRGGRPARPSAPRGCGRRGRCGAPGGARGGPPPAPFPSEGKPPPVRGETPPGSLWPRSGRLLVLSPRGLGRPGCGAAEAAARGGAGAGRRQRMECGRLGRQPLVHGNVLGRSSLKCGASHSLIQPLSRGGRRRARRGALPFLCSLAHTPSPLPPSPAPRARPGAPAPPGRAHPPRLRPGPSSSPRPPPPPPQCLRLQRTPSPPQSPGVVVWRLRLVGWRAWGPGKRTWTGSEPGNVHRREVRCVTQRGDPLFQERQGNSSSP
nr:uncharacterized protein LOC116157272 [Camelus dromedarius]